MRRAEYDEQQIIEAGQVLAAEGRRVTGFAIRERLGGGNANRIRQVWEEFQAGQSNLVTEAVAELPVEVAEQLEHFIATLGQTVTNLTVELNDRAVKAAERRTAQLVRTTSEQREQAERELSDASEAVEELEDMLANVRAELAKAQERLASVDEKRQSLSLELASARETIAASARSAQEVAAAHAERVRELSEELEDARRMGQLSRDEHSQALGNLQAAEKTHLDDVEIITRLRLEHGVLTGQHATARAQLEERTESLASARAELAELAGVAEQLAIVKAKLEDKSQELQTATAEGKAALERATRAEAALQNASQTEPASAAPKAKPAKKSDPKA